MYENNCCAVEAVLPDKPNKPEQTMRSLITEQGMMVAELESCIGNIKSFIKGVPNAGKANRKSPECLMDEVRENSETLIECIRAVRELGQTLGIDF